MRRIEVVIRRVCVFCQLGDCVERVSMSARVRSQLRGLLSSFRASSAVQHHQPLRHVILILRANTPSPAVSVRTARRRSVLS